DLTAYHSGPMGALNRRVRRKGGGGGLRLRSAAAAEEMRDGYDDDRANGGCGETINEATAHDAELYKNPAAEYGADQSEDNVCDTSETLATRKFSSEPASD